MMMMIITIIIVIVVTITTTQVPLRSRPPGRDLFPRPPRGPMAGPCESTGAEGPLIELLHSLRPPHRILTFVCKFECDNSGIC